MEHPKHASQYVLPARVEHRLTPSLRDTRQLETSMPCFFLAVSPMREKTIAKVLTGEAM